VAVPWPLRAQRSRFGPGRVSLLLQRPSYDTHVIPPTDTLGPTPDLRHDEDREPAVESPVATLIVFGDDDTLICLDETCVPAEAFE
jgi:hypothetical protein